MKQEEKPETKSNTQSIKNPQKRFKMFPHENPGIENLNTRTAFTYTHMMNGVSLVFA